MQILLENYVFLRRIKRYNEYTRNSFRKRKTLEFLVMYNLFSKVILFSFLRSKQSYSLFFFILICLNEATRIPNIPHFHVLQRIRKKRQFPLLSTPSSPIKSVIGYINRSSCHPERESDFAIGRETGSSPAILGLSSATRLITLIVSRNNPSSLTFPAPSGSSFKEETSD